jgi:hypothetical protein
MLIEYGGILRMLGRVHCAIHYYSDLKLSLKASKEGFRYVAAHTSVVSVYWQLGSLSNG